MQTPPGRADVVRRMQDHIEENLGRPVTLLALAAGRAAHPGTPAGSSKR
jgi:hypothetical protein